MSVNRWCLTRDGGNFVIRRWANGKYERLPTIQYKAFRDNLEEMQAFVSRLNARYDEEARAKEAVMFKHAFISPSMLDDYRTFLLAQCSRDSAAVEYGRVIKYVLNYFIAVLDLKDPVEWHKVHQTKWASYLESLKYSPSTLRSIIQAANRFTTWLHMRRPDVAQPVQFKPFTRAKFKTMAAVYELEERKQPRQFIPHAEWRKIRKSLPPSIKAAVCLCYYYGFRRAEVLGLRLSDLRRDYLYLERQYAGKGEHGILKGKEPRKTPHWFGRPLATYHLISQIKLLHPDTLSDLFREVTGGKYTLHDIRHTYITRAMRKHNVRDVMLAVGHKNIETTMKYLKDDRTLDDDIYVPVKIA